MTIVNNKEKVTLKILLLPRLFLCAVLGVMGADATMASTTMSLELFQIRQFEQQYEQLAQIYAADADLFLDVSQSEFEVATDVKRAFDYLGISELQLDRLMKGIADYTDGVFLPGYFECADKAFQAYPTDTTTSAAWIRLQLLSQHGARLLWGTMEMSAYREAIIQQEFSDVHLPAICHRVDQLYKVLACLAKDPSRCEGDIASALKQVPFTAGRGDSEKLIFAVSRQVEPIKNAFHPYMDHLTWLLASTESPLTKTILHAVSAEPRDFDRLEQVLSDTLVEHFQRQASVALFEVYLNMPTVARAALGSHGNIKMAVSEAIDAMEIIRAHRVQLDTNDEVETLAKEQYDQTVFEAEQVVEAAINDIGKSMLAFLSPYEATVPPEKVNEVLDLHADKICDALLQEAVTDNWGSNQWGVAPTESNPIGFRFAFSPADKQEEIYGQTRDLYKGELQLLVYMSPGAFKPFPASNNQKEKFSCVQDSVPTYSVLSTGYTFENAYKDLTAPISAGGFLQYTGGAMHRTDSYLPPLQSALEKLGIISEWIEGDPSWSVSKDFKNITVTIDISGKKIPIEILKRGAVTLNVVEVGRKVCNAVESNVLPSIVTSWAQDYPIRLGNDWSLLVSGDGKGQIDIAACDQLYVNDLKSLPHPLQNSHLAVSAQVVLNGVVHDTVFQWPALANLLFKNRGVVLKSLVFGDTPPAVKSVVKGVFGLTKQRWTFGGLDSLMFTVVTGSLEPADDLRSMRLPIFVQVGSSTCAAHSISAYFVFPNGDLMDVGSLENAVKEAAFCSAQRKINEYIAVNILQCDRFNGNVFGLTSVTVDVDEARSTDRVCYFDIDGQFGSHQVSINSIQGHRLDNGGGFKLDFSAASLDNSLVTAIRSQISKTVSDMTVDRVAVDNLRFFKQSLMFDLSFTFLAPIGTIEIGTVSLSAETGQITIDTELNRVLANRVVAYLKPKLKRIIETIAPDIIKEPKIIPKYENGRFSVYAVFSVRVHEDLPPISAKVDLIPTLSTEIYIDKAAIKAAVSGALDEFVFNQLPLKVRPVKAEFKDYYLSPSYELTLIAGVSINLDELGEITVDRIYIGENGVAFRGRAELRVGIPLYLVPAPVPIVLTRPGVIYDFDKAYVGASGALTIIEPDIDKLFHIDATLGVGDPEKFITQLSLTGDLVLLNSIPVIMTEGVLDFKRLQATFSGETSGVFNAVMDAQVKGELEPKEGTASLETKLAIFGTVISRAQFIINIRKCPKRCIKGNANINLLIGKGAVAAEFGPFLVDALLKTDISLEIFGEELGSATVEVESLRAHLKAKVLEILKLSIRTPGLREMSPSYIAEVIASLLDVDLKDVLNWLKNPKIEIAPVGSSGDSDGDEGEANSDGADDSSRQSHRDTTGGAPPPTIAGGDGVKPPAEEISTLPPEYNYSPQRFPVHNGNSIVGCSDQDNSWGFIVYYARWESWGFRERIWGMPQDIFDKVCKRHGNGKGPWGHLNVFAIEDNYHPLYTFSTLGYESSEEVCIITNKTKQCVTDFPSYRVRHLSLKSDEESKRIPTTISYIGRDYVSETAAMATTYNAFVELDQEVGEEIKSKIAEPYVQKILRGELRNQEGIYPDVITAISESKIGDGDDYADKLSSLFLSASNYFSSSILNYTVTYGMVEGNQHSYCHENAVIFIDKTGQVLFSHNCPVWKNEKKMAHFLRLQGDAENNRVKRLLNDGLIPSDSGKMTVLSKQQTHWFVNIAMPSLISGRVTPDIGTPINIDRTVGQCRSSAEVESIYVLDNGDSLSLNITKNLQKSSSTESSQLLIAKRGGHRAWTESTDPTLLNTMASFLACQSYPVRWIETHRLWLPPQGHTLLFYPVNPSADSYKPVIEIQPNHPPRTISMPSIDPYSGARPTTEVKRRLYSRVKGTLIKRVTFIVNRDKGWEILVKDSPDGKIDVDLIPIVCTQPAPAGSTDLPVCSLTLPLNDVCDSNVEVAKKMYSLDTQELLGCFANFGPTRIRPSSKDASGILQYLRLDNPVARTGVGPHKLFRELDKHDARSCKPI